MNNSNRKRLWLSRLGIALFLGAAIIFAYFRFFKGLGSVTHLSDQTPWGIWVGFDILAGIGLAAGGFIMTATVYIFRLKRYRRFVRMSILTALLGYLVFIVGLVLELGRPWNIWRCLVNHNIHSPLFEVAWCVMLYTFVLLLEFSEIVSEKFGWFRWIKIIQRVKVPLVIAGVLLSTLHQSTLGTLFTIIPAKLHPLWYSSMQPILFFLSCIPAGLAMVCLESLLSWRFFKHPLALDLLSNLARVMTFALIVFFVFRIEDLFMRGAWRLAFAASAPALIFWIETLLLVLIPALLTITAKRDLPAKRLGIIAISVTVGFIFHRLNVAVIGIQFVNPTPYVPTIVEVLVSLSLVMVGAFVVAAVVRRFPVFEHDEKEVRFFFKG